MSFNSNEMNMNWKIMDSNRQDTYWIWMDNKKMLSCNRLNKMSCKKTNPLESNTTWRVSKTCVSRRLSLLTKRKETQKNTTRIREDGRREKDSVI